MTDLFVRGDVFLPYFRSFCQGACNFITAD